MFVAGGEIRPFRQRRSGKRSTKIYDVGEAAIFEFDKYGAKKVSVHARSTSKALDISTNDAEEQKCNPKGIPALKRRPPPPPRSTATYDIKNQTWRQNRPVMVREGR
jgi:hypothetical protein